MVDMLALLMRVDRSPEDRAPSSAFTAGVALMSSLQQGACRVRRASAEPMAMTLTARESWRSSRAQDAATRLWRAARRSARMRANRRCQAPVVESSFDAAPTRDFGGP